MCRIVLLIKIVIAFLKIHFNDKNNLAEYINYKLLETGVNFFKINYMKENRF